MLKIKELRNDLSLTQREFAEKINLDAHNIGDWERGKGEPSSEYLVKIARTFNVSTDYLLGCEEDFSSPSQSTGPKKIFPHLSAQEEELIKNFRKLDVYAQGAILIQTKALAENRDVEPQKIKK